MSWVVTGSDTELAAKDFVYPHRFGEANVAATRNKRRVLWVSSRLARSILVDLAHVAMRERAPRRVCHQRGMVDTDCLSVCRPKVPYRGRSAALERLIPLGRGGEPDEIVGAALYLASEASAYATAACSKSTAVPLPTWGRRHDSK